jgi:hypothetical protein
MASQLVIGTAGRVSVIIDCVPIVAYGVGARSLVSVVSPSYAVVNFDHTTITQCSHACIETLLYSDCSLPASTDLFKLLSEEEEEEDCRRRCRMTTMTTMTAATTISALNKPTRPATSDDLGADMSGATVDVDKLVVPPIVDSAT